MDKRSDWLDAMMKGEEQYIEDAGFTDRVLCALPHKRRRTFRSAILLTSTALACLVAFVVFPGGQFLLDTVASVIQFGTAPTTTAIPIAPLVVLALIVWGGAALAAHEA